MKAIFISISVIYFIVGILIYIFTDTSKFAGKIERMFLFLTYADVNRHIFLLVVLLWPVWLYVNSKFND